MCRYLFPYYWLSFDVSKDRLDKPVVMSEGDLEHVVVRVVKREALLLDQYEVTYTQIFLNFWAHCEHPP